MAGSKSTKQPPLMTPGQLITAFIFSNILFLILGMAIGKGDFSTPPTEPLEETVKQEEPKQEVEPKTAAMKEFYSLEETPADQEKKHIPLAKAKTEPAKPKQRATPPPTTTKKKVNQKVKKAPPKAPTETRGKFYLQLAASKDHTQAVKFLKRVQDKGYPATLQKEAGFYKVRLGNYDTREKAIRMKTDIDAALRIDSWVKSK